MSNIRMDGMYTSIEDEIEHLQGEKHFLQERKDHLKAQKTSLALASTLSALQRVINNLEPKHTTAEDAAISAWQSAVNTAPTQPVSTALTADANTVPGTGGQQAATQAEGHKVNLGGLVRNLSTTKLLRAGCNLPTLEVVNLLYPKPHWSVP